MPKSVLEMVVEIVLSQAGQAIMSAEEIDRLIKQIYRSLKEIEGFETGWGSSEKHAIPNETQFSQPLQGQRILGPKSDSAESIREDAIECLECGKEFRTLTHTHLKEHDLNPEEYKRKWGFSAKQPLAAKSVSERRKEQARNRNLGEELKKAREAKRADQSLRQADASKEGIGEGKNEQESRN